MSGTAALRWRPSRGSAAAIHPAPSSCRRNPRHARSGGRTALAAALVAAMLLSPGARDACAGCCRDGAPAVAAPLAAGVAPVHSCCAAPVPVAPDGCCGAAAARATGHDDSAGVPGCAADRSDCRCHLTTRDRLPADPARRGCAKRQVDDLAGTTPDVVSLPHAATVIRSTWTVATGIPPDRPVRILYGVWRN